MVDAWTRRCRRWGSNPHVPEGHGILSPAASASSATPAGTRDRRGGRRHERRPSVPAALRLGMRRHAIGILTGGGDVPGSTRASRPSSTVSRRTGTRSSACAAAGRRSSSHDLATRHPRPIASPLDPASSARSTAPAARSSTRRGRTRATTAEARARRTSPAARARGPVRPHPARPPRLESLGIDVAHPDRRRRHADLCVAAPRRGRARDRHPEDDGQRRPRHRLLHRLLDRDHTRRAVHPQPAHVAGSHERIAVVELFGRYCGETSLDHRLPRRRRPRDHLRGAVRHRPARRAARRGQALEPVELRDGDRFRGRHDRRRRDGRCRARRTRTGTASSAASAR